MGNSIRAYRWWSDDTQRSCGRRRQIIEGADGLNTFDFFQFLDEYSLEAAAQGIDGALTGFIGTTSKPWSLYHLKTLFPYFDRSDEAPKTAKFAEDMNSL